MVHAESNIYGVYFVLVHYQ